MSERCKTVNLKASIAYLVKDTLERLQLNNIKESRMVVTMLDILDVSFDMPALEGERQRHIEIQKKAVNAYNDGKANAEQEKLVNTQRYNWWKTVYAALDEMHPAKSVSAPESAFNFVAELLGKQAFDATGARMAMQFVDMVDAAPSTVLAAA